MALCEGLSFPSKITIHFLVKTFFCDSAQLWDAKFIILVISVLAMVWLLIIFLVDKYKPSKVIIAALGTPRSTWSSTTKKYIFWKFSASRLRILNNSLYLTDSKSYLESKSGNRPSGINKCSPPLTLIITFIEYLDTSRDDKHFTHRKFSYPTSGSWRCSTGEKWIHHILLIFSTGWSWRVMAETIWRSMNINHYF